MLMMDIQKDLRIVKNRNHWFVFYKTKIIEIKKQL